LACSAAESEELLRWVPQEQLVIVPHGVEVPSSDPREAADLFLERFPQCRGRRTILFLARVDAVKRPEIILAAMARLRPRFPDLTLVVAGPDGGYMKKLRAAVARHGLEDSIVYAGFLENDLKRGAFAVASVLALPSAHENFGIAVTEAMAHGLPALVTPEVASHVHVDLSGAGLTVHGDPESFAEGLAQLLTADQRDAMGRKGRQYVEANLAWSRIGRQLEALYQDVAARRNPTR
jgi:glycosyltransferase involved in cell wall biosynthesis